MTQSANLLQEINGFYRRWQSFESTLGKDAGSVLDFDYCPPEDAAPGTLFSDRLAVLDELERLQSAVQASSGSFSNKDFLRLKLEGANAYLRTLMGERLPFERYLEATIGITPKPLPKEELAAMKESAEAEVSKLGVRWSAANRQRFDELTRYPDMQTFGDSLRSFAKLWVERVRNRLDLDIQPDYRIETVEVDEYWHNWIDGKLGSAILLRVNTHPRAVFRRGDEVRLAAHEIAGHAINILAFDREREAGKIEGTLMNTTVHSCEMFQMEGIAQSVMHLIAEEGEIDEHTRRHEALGMYHLAVINNAQCEIEAGRPVDAVLKAAGNAAPFLEPLTLASDIRDRGRNTLFRAYVFVYSPSMQMFLKAKKLPMEKRRAFLQSMYTAFWTPEQIEAVLAESALEGIVAT